MMTTSWLPQRAASTFAPMDDLLNVLPSVFFLHDQDAAVRRSFAELSVCRSYPKGNILFHHGDPCFAAYVIISGRIKLTVADDDGREFALEVFGPGDVAGLIAALDGGAHNGTAITLSPCRVAIVPRERFDAWITAHPLLLHTIVGALVKMLRGVYERVGIQALLPVKRRVRAAMIELAQADGVLDDGEYVTSRPTHQELAERIGSTRVVVARAIKELLEEEPWIRMDGRTLRVRLDFGDVRQPTGTR
jgi:CRP/FNR family cyclic AMP-dependent transcriptional regulator